MRGVARAALWLALMGSALLALGSDPEAKLISAVSDQQAGLCLGV